MIWLSTPVAKWVWPLTRLVIQGDYDVDSHRCRVIIVGYGIVFSLIVVVVFVMEVVCVVIMDRVMTYVTWRAMLVEYSQYSVPRSEVTCDGTPCFENTWSTNSFASIGAVMVSMVGMNSDCLGGYSESSDICTCRVFCLYFIVHVDICCMRDSL